MLESEIHSSAEKVHELLAELQNQRVEEQIAKTRGDIYASIIHDINGPLTVISGFVQLLNKRLNRTSRLEVEDLEFIKERLRIIERQMANCIEISRRYLGFLRQQSGDTPRRRASASCSSDLEQLVRVHPSMQENEFSRHAARRRHRRQDQRHGRDPDFAEPGGQRVSMHAAAASRGGRRRGVARAAGLAAFKDGPHDRLLNVESMDNTAPLVKFWVRDTGPGIPAEVLPKIFQPYFTTKGPRQGTGLGLNIVQRLIKEGNGALHFHTRPGEGTTFTVYLPAAQSWMRSEMQRS